MYGPDAYAGVINLITRDGGELDGFELRSGYVSTGAWDGSALFGKRVDQHTDFVLGLRAFHGQDFALHEHYTHPDDYGPVGLYSGALGELENEYPIQNFNLLAKIRHKRLSLSLDWQRYYETNAYTALPWLYAYVRENVWAQDLRHLNLTHQTIDREKFDLRASLSLGDYEVDPASNFTTVNSDLTQKGAAFKYAYSAQIQGSVQATWTPSESFSLVAGGLYAWVKSFPKTQNLPEPFAANGELIDDLRFYTDALGFVFGSYELSDPYFGRRDFSNLGAFAQANYRPIQTLSATAGLRYDYNSGFGPTLNPRLGLVFEPLAKLKLKAMYGHAYIQPSNYDKWENWAIPGYMHIPNTKIKPERLRAYEFSANYFPTQDISLRLSLFHNDMRDIIRPISGLTPQEHNNGRAFFNPYGNGGVEHNGNLGRITSQGIELAASAQVGKFLPSLAYSLLEGEDFESGLSVPKISTHKVQAALTFRHRKLSATLHMRYFSDIHTSPQNTLYGELGDKSYLLPANLAILYANLVWSPSESLSVSLAVDNVLNTAYYGSSPYNETGWLVARAPQALRKSSIAISHRF